VAVAVVALLVGAPVACGGDDGAGPDGRSVDTGEPGDTDDNGDTIPVDGSTSSSEAPPPPPTEPAESPLGGLLTDPGDVGATYAPAPARRGDGAFEDDLCESVKVEHTWTESASQLLVTGPEPDAASYAEALLGFADEEAAATFVSAVVDGFHECLPNYVTEAFDIGDETVVVRLELPEDAEDVDHRTALIRVGSRVGTMQASTPGSGSPITEDLMRSVAFALGG